MSVVSSQVFAFAPLRSHMLLDLFKRFSNPLNLKGNRHEAGQCTNIPRGNQQSRQVSGWCHDPALYCRIVRKQEWKQDAIIHSRSQIINQQIIEAEIGNSLVLHCRDCLSCNTFANMLCSSLQTRPNSRET